MAKHTHKVLNKVSTLYGLKNKFCKGRRVVVFYDRYKLIVVNLHLFAAKM